MPAKAKSMRTKSAIKRARQTEKRALRNRALKSMLKSLARKVNLEVANKNIDASKTALNKAIAAINRAAAKGIIHKNTAARKVSSLTRRVNSSLLSGAA